MYLWIFTILLVLPFLVLFFFFVLFFCKLAKRISYSAQVLSAICIDVAVDEFFRKAVIIAQDQFRGSSLDDDEKQKRIIEKACSIVADVLLQHGLSPKEYNLSALVGVARYREKFDIML